MCILHWFRNPLKAFTSGKVKVRVRPFDEMGTKFVGFKVTRDKEKEIVLVVFKRHEIPFGKAVVISDGEYSLPVEESSDDESDDESDPGTSFL